MRRWEVIRESRGRPITEERLEYLLKGGAGGAGEVGGSAKRGAYRAVLEVSYSINRPPSYPNFRFLSP